MNTVYLFVFIMAAKSALTPYKIYSPFSDDMYLWDLKGNHTIIGLKNNTYSPMRISLWYHNLRTNQSQFMHWSQQGILKVTTHANNTATRGSIILAYETSIRIWNLTANTSLLYSSNNGSVVCQFFGINLQHVFFFTINKNNGATYINKISFGVQQPSFTLYNLVISKALFVNQLIYVKCQILLPSYFELRVYHSQNFTNTSLNINYSGFPNPLFDANERYMAIANVNGIQIKESFAPYQSLRNITTNLIIKSVLLVGFEEVVVYCIGETFLLYNLTTGNLSDYKTSSISFNNGQIYYTGEFVVFVHENGIITFNAPDVINSTILPTPTPTTIPPTPTPIPTTPTTPTNESQLNSTNPEVTRNKVVASASQATGNLLALRGNFRFALPIIILIEDLWPYKFHYGIKYPYFMELCMTEVDVMNQLRLKPSFLNKFELKFQILNDQHYDKEYMKLIRSHHHKNGQGISYEHFYFMFVTRDIYIISIPINIAMFLLYILLKKCLQCLNRGDGFLNEIYESIKLKTRPWMLVDSILQGCFIRLSYVCFNKLTTPSVFAFSNKVDLILSIVVLFLVVQFSAVGYILINHYHKSSSESLMISTKFSTTSAALQNIMSLSSRFLVSFCHSNIILRHSTKIVSLLLFNACFTIVMIFFRKYFFNFLTFFVYFLYSLAFLTLNLFLYANWLKINPISLVMEEATKSIIVALFGLTILKILLSIVRNVQELMNSCQNSKIQHFENQQDVFHQTNQTATVKVEKNTLTKVLEMNQQSEEEEKARNVQVIGERQTRRFKFVFKKKTKFEQNVQKTVYIF